MQMLQREHGLREPPQDAILGDELTASARPLDATRKLATLTEVHEDAQPALVREALAVPHHIRMTQRRKQLGLFDGILELLTASPADIYHLTNPLLARLSLNQNCTAIRALTDFLDFLQLMPLENHTNGLVSQTTHGCHGSP